MNVAKRIAHLRAGRSMRPRPAGERKSIAKSKKRAPMARKILQARQAAKAPRGIY